MKQYFLERVNVARLGLFEGLKQHFNAYFPVKAGIVWIILL